MARLQKSRDKILATAGRLFSENGYDATSVHEICMTAGVSKGAFYHYFSTKETLFLILLEDWVERMKQVLVGEGDGLAPFPESLPEMAGRSREIFQTTEKNFSVMIDFWKEAVRDPAVWARSVRPFEEFLRSLREQALAGQQAGFIRSDIDPGSTAYLLSACVLGYLLQAALDPGRLDWTELARNGMELVVANLKK